jgi:cytochrome c oxidase subunit II
MDRVVGGTILGAFWTMLRAAGRIGLCLGGCALFGATAAFADYGQPSPWQMGMQGAATPIAEQEHAFHFFLLVFITVIVLFVLGLLLWIMVRYNERANPTPSRTTHNTLLEVAWTIVPVLILVAIAIPSFRLLYAQYDFGEPDLRLKITGYQWYWGVEYVSEAPVAYEIRMTPEAELKEGQPRLLTVDNDIVVPVNKLVNVQVTGADVIHSFAMPSFGVKTDAVPGRLNETWFRATRLGTYHGQCSELCGRDHAFMPLTIRVVSDEEYASWLAGAKQRYAEAAPGAPAGAQMMADATSRTAN